MCISWSLRILPLNSLLRKKQFLDGSTNRLEIDRIQSCQCTRTGAYNGMQSIRFQYTVYVTLAFEITQSQPRQQIYWRNLDLNNLLMLNIFVSTLYNPTNVAATGRRTLCIFCSFIVDSIAAEPNKKSQQCSYTQQFLLECSVFLIFLPIHDTERHHLCRTSSLSTILFLDEASQTRGIKRQASKPRHGPCSKKIQFNKGMEQIFGTSYLEMRRNDSGVLEVLIDRWENLPDSTDSDFAVFQ